MLELRGTWLGVPQFCLALLNLDHNRSTFALRGHKEHNRWGQLIQQWCAGTIFDSLLGFDPQTYPPAIMVFYSPAFFETCTFRKLSVARGSVPLEARDNVLGAIHASGLNASLAFQNCSFADIRSEHLISALEGSAVYSDNPAQTVRLQPASHRRAPLPSLRKLHTSHVMMGARAMLDTRAHAHVLRASW